MTAMCQHHKEKSACPACAALAVEASSQAFRDKAEKEAGHRLEAKAALRDEAELNAAKAMPEEIPEEEKWERTGKKISLHGLGFLQVEFTPTMRLHIWHPDLPRRSCFKHSQVHDHRFGFDSTVLVGCQENHVYSFEEMEEWANGDYYQRYIHEGPRAETGNRPWISTGQPIELIHHDTQFVHVGETYHMRPYVFHKTVAVYGGKVATLMVKTSEHDEPATSTCVVGVDPDVEFNRFQMGVHEMWEVVSDVLGSSGISAPAHPDTVP